MSLSIVLDVLFAVEGLYMLITGNAMGGNKGWGKKYSEESKRKFMRLMGVISILVGAIFFVTNYPGLITSKAVLLSVLIGGLVFCFAASLLGWKLMLKKKSAAEAMVENGHLVYVDED